MNLSSDEYRRRSEILLEILRIGVVAFRNLAAGRRWLIGRRAMMIEWSELCHTIPILLREDVDDAAYLWFVENHATMFLAKYPRQRDAYFIQVAELLAELETLVRGSAGRG